MAGYNGYSMSNNAISAYNSGEKPLSKWTKGNIIAEIEKIAERKIPNLKKIPIGILKSEFLTKSSWHHTSCHYNRTDFYSVDEYAIDELSEERISALIARAEENKEKKPENPQPEKWECQFLIWSGSRKHPKAEKMKAIGEIKGNWLYLSDGTKKSTTANGFYKLRKI